MKKLSAECCQKPLFFVLYGCDTWSPTVSEEHRLKVFGNRVLRNVFGVFGNRLLRNVFGAFGNRVLRNVFGPTGHEVTGEWGR